MAFITYDILPPSYRRQRPSAVRLSLPATSDVAFGFWLFLDRMSSGSQKLFSLRLCWMFDDERVRR